MKQKFIDQIVDLIDKAVERYDDDYNWVLGPVETVRMVYAENKDECSAKARDWLTVKLSHGGLDNHKFLRNWLKVNHHGTWLEVKVVAHTEDERWFRVYWKNWLAQIRAELAPDHHCSRSQYTINPASWAQP